MHTVSIPKKSTINKTELLNWLREEHQQWEALLEGIGPNRMDQVSVTSHWSFKVLLAHLTPDGLQCVAQLQALQRNESEPRHRGRPFTKR